MGDLVMPPGLQLLLITFHTVNDLITLFEKKKMAKEHISTQK